MSDNEALLLLASFIFVVVVLGVVAKDCADENL